MREHLFAGLGRRRQRREGDGGEKLIHYHAPRIIRGIVYDLSHLDPFQIFVKSDKVARELKVNVRFSNHCFSEGFDPAKHSPDEPVVMDGTRRRAFCPVRYRFSLRLPALIGGMVAPGVQVHQTASKRNWVYSITLIDPHGTKYHVFFDLRRTREQQRHLQDLEMFIESAYAVSLSKAAPNILGRVNFALLAGNIFMGKAVNTWRK